MTKEEAINVLLKVRPCIIDNAQEDALDIAIEALSKPSLPSNLDEAAEKYANRGISSNAEPYEEIIAYRADKDAFKAGSEWLAEQGISVEGDTDNGLPDEYFIKLEDYLNSLPKGTKLVFQIRKKQ